MNYSRSSINTHDFIHGSKKFAKVLEKMAIAKKTNTPVLICGETGTGKEIVARNIHFSGLRSKGPFIPIHAGALPSDLIESELFGFKKGVFTGASFDSMGLLRSAKHGTIFFDEMTEMAPLLQVKLTRVLEDKKVRPVGSHEEYEIDFRLISATNRDIAQAVEEGSFRKDLYYRVGVIIINMPPLRNVKENIPLLINNFISIFNHKFKRKIRGFDSNALTIFNDYNWPGNVRELRNVIENAFIIANEEIITENDICIEYFSGKHLEAKSVHGQGEKIINLTQQSSSKLNCWEMKKCNNTQCPFFLKDLNNNFNLGQIEKNIIHRALKISKNKTKAAEMLGISRTKLYNKINIYNK